MLLPDPWTRPSLSVKDTAALLDRSTAAVYDAVAAGTIPAVRVGRAVSIPTAWLYEQLHLPIPPRPTT